MIYLAEIRTGARGVVLARSKANPTRSEFAKFLLQMQANNRGSYNSTRAMIKLWCDEGSPGTSGAQFKPLCKKEGIREWRPGRYRLIWFQVGNAAIISHGFWKDQNAVPEREIERGRSFRRIYLAAKENEVVLQKLPKKRGA